ncbi:hypothetical protein [Bacillus cereus]
MNLIAKNRFIIQGNGTHIKFEDIDRVFTGVNGRVHTKLKGLGL